ncbi:hypothetical protein [Streptococcus sp. IMAU 99161]
MYSWLFNSSADCCQWLGTG